MSSVIPSELERLASTLSVPVADDISRVKPCDAVETLIAAAAAAAAVSSEPPPPSDAVDPDAEDTNDISGVSSETSDDEGFCFDAEFIEAIDLSNRVKKAARFMTKVSFFDISQSSGLGD
jgi:3-hydroxy-3-methylglutaryl CoA synthase